MTKPTLGIMHTIDQVIDKKAFNTEVAQERTDAAHNAGVREIVLRTLQAQIRENREATR